MANSPQLENGYTRIANELIEAMAQHDFGFSKGQVFAAVIRLTYGWNKKNDKISISRICELTHLSKRTVIYTLKNLEVQNKVVINRSISNGVKNINQIGIQKNYKLWNDQNLTPQYMKLKDQAKIRSAKLRSAKSLRVVQNSASGSAKLHDLVVQNPANNDNSFAHTKEIITKDIIKETIQKKEYAHLDDVEEKDMVEIAERYQVPLAFVRSIHDDMVLWAGSRPDNTKLKGRNWKLTLMKWVKKDAMERREHAESNSRIAYVGEPIADSP